MKIIYLTKGKVAKVDDEDFDKLNSRRWCAHKTKGGRWYAQASHIVNGKFKGLPMHRFIMNTPDDMVCDHINGDSLDNRKSNLRNCTRSQNAMNRGSLRGSQYKGIYLNTHSRPGAEGKVLKYAYWKACIIVGGKRISLGSYKAEIEAAKVYDEAAKKYHGEFALLNFPEQKEKQVYCNLCITEMKMQRVAA